MQCIIYKIFKHSTIKSGVLFKCYLNFHLFLWLYLENISKNCATFYQKLQLCLQIVGKKYQFFPYNHQNIYANILIEIKLDNAEMASREVCFIGTLWAKIKEPVVAFCGRWRKRISMSFLIPNFIKRS